MKIYVVDGRKVWLDKAPEGYEEPKKVEPVKVEEKTEEAKVEPKAEPKPKAKKAPANKVRKAGSNK